METNIVSNKYNYLDFNHINYFQDKELEFYKNIRKEIKVEYEALDKSLRESKMRKQKSYVIKGYVPRTIITIFGEVTFIRTKYQYFDAELNKNKTVYLLDNYIQIEPYQRINLHLRLEIMKELSTGKRQRDIVDQYKVAGITRVSISNLARKIDTKDLTETSIYWDYKIPKEIKEKQYIYLNVDDTFTSLRENKVKNDYRIRLGVAHLGYINPNLKRKELLQKRAFYNIAKIPVTKNSIPTIEYAEKIQEQLTIFYGDISDKKIVVCGDGANWIQELANCLSADYVLDKYHVTSLIYKTFPHRRKSKKKIKDIKKQEINALHKDIYEKCCCLLNKGEVDSLILYLQSIQEIDLLSGKKVKIKELITYISNHRVGIINYQKPYYIGSQTEAMVSHLVKSIKGYGAKLYNYKTFVNLLNLRLGNINQLKPIDIYCNQIFEIAEINKAYYSENIWKKYRYSNKIFVEKYFQSDIVGIQEMKNHKVKNLLYYLAYNK